MRMSELATAIAYFNIGRYTSYTNTLEQKNFDRQAEQQKILALYGQYREQGGLARLIYSPSKNVYRVEFSS